MTDRKIRSYLLAKPNVQERFPFGAEISVYKVQHKMFATLALGKADEQQKSFWWLNLKCDPKEAVMLRNIFPAVIPGYHMNKVHWNTVILDGSIPQGEVERMIDNSFRLVVANMSKKDQFSINIKL